LPRSSNSFNTFRAFESEHRQYVVLGDLVPAKRDQLVERALRVAQAAFGPARNRGQRRVIDRHFLFFGDAAEVLDDQARRNPPQIEPLAARQDCRQHFLRFRRGEEKLHVRGWFFERFEQRIERLRREHVHFVDDVNLEPATRWRVADGLAQLADLLDAIIRRAVDFQHV